MSYVNYVSYVNNMSYVTYMSIFMNCFKDNDLVYKSFGYFIC